MARRFDAASLSYLGNSTAPMSAVPLTMACWAKPLTSAANGILIYVGAPNSSADYFTLEAYVASLNARTRTTVPGAVSVASTLATLTPGVWTHCAAVFASATSRTVYKNGAAGTTETTSAVPAGTHRIAVGLLWRSSPVEYFDGLIAGPAVWDVALSGGDIALLAAGASPMSLSTLPVRYWPLRDDGGFTDVVAGNVLTNTATLHSPDWPLAADLGYFGLFPNPGFPLARAA